MELQVGVKAFLKNGQGKYLILKRSEKYREVGNERWDIPGGRIDAGRTLVENLKREIEEETGLHLKEEPILIYAQDILKVEGRHVVRLTYIGKIDGNPRIDHESTDFRWAEYKEMLGMKDMDSFAKEVLVKRKESFG